MPARAFYRRWSYSRKRILAPALVLSLLFLAGVLLAALAVARYDAERFERTFTTGGPHPAVGEAAPDFALRDTDGREFRLSDYVGRLPVVIEFSSFT